jgi:hypothetical protein
MKPMETAVGVSGRLTNAIQLKWAATSEALVRNFKHESLRALKEERDFGTMNHYLSAKFLAETLAPQAFLEKFVGDLKWTDLTMPYEKTPHNYDTTSGPYVNNLGDIDWKANLLDQLTQHRYNWAKEFGRKTLHEQSLQRVFAAVKAAWAVEKKTYTDMVLKKCRDSVIKARIDWIETTLLLDNELRAEALEDLSVELKRAELKKTIAAMQSSLEELKKIM